MPTLYEQIEQEEKDLENASKETEKPEAEPEETVEAQEETASEEQVEEAPEEDKQDTEEPKAEAKTEEKQDNAAFARMRRENAALQRRLAEIEAAKSAPAPERPVAAKPAEAVPDKAVNPEAYAQWELHQTKEKLEEVARKQEIREQQEQHAQIYQAAIQEFTTYESSFKKQTQDYEHVAQHLRHKIADGLRALYPEAEDNQVEAAVDQQILRFASDYAKRGLNPVEELYHMTKERYGYKAPEPEKKKGPDLATIEKNKKRSASPLASGGQSKGSRLSIEAAADMPLAEFSKLTPAQLAELERGAA
jgi:hypothetical protein